VGKVGSMQGGSQTLKSCICIGEFTLVSVSFLFIRDVETTQERESFLHFCVNFCVLKIFVHQKIIHVEH
jgi:hypothetical protein